jgi:L-fucose isomerase
MQKQLPQIETVSRYAKPTSLKQFPAMPSQHPSPLNGSFPKIGIRPTIDGRRQGVRESLEGQVMNMAKTAAKFLSANLRYPNGRPVQCVIADTCIGGVAEAAACAEKFAREGVGVSLTVTPCWCYGSETMDMDPLIPKAIWGYNGTERPGAVYLAAVLAAHNQKGLPAFSIYGRDVQDAGDGSIPADVREKLLRFARAGLAVALMRGKSYLSLGGVSMGIAGSIVDQSFFEEYLGIRVECVDMSELTRRIEEKIYDEKEFKKAHAWTRKNCPEGKDRNPAQKQRDAARKNSEWEIAVKMTLIARDLMQGNPRLAELGFGEEAPVIMATENDALNGACMLMGYLLTNTAQIFADVRTYWSPDAVKRVTGTKLTGAAANGLLHLINSGSATLDGTGRQERDGKPALKPFWEISKAEADACLKATSWPAAVYEYFRGGGFSSCFLTRGGMPMTMCRISLVKGLGPVLQIAEGWSVDLPAKVHQTLDERTDPSWPTTWFAPNLTGQGVFRDVYTVMANWSANHGSISYGHIGADLISLASLLRIPVAMHNVAEDQIFRPSTWSLCGALEPQAADYRACTTFGPLYG